MITLQIWHLVLILLVNLIIVAFFFINWFLKNYTITDLETWNKIVDFYNEHNSEPEELAGGCGGFFREYISEECDDNDDDGVEPEEDDR